MKKALSVLLSIVIAVTAIVPGFLGLDFATFKAEATTSGAGDAYATILTASDLQTYDYLVNMENIMTQIIEDGVTETPAAFLFGGDFQADSNNTAEATVDHINMVRNLFDDFYPYYNTIDDMVFIQGNHDVVGSEHHATGLHDKGDFLTYTINYTDLELGNKNDAQAIAASLTQSLDALLADGEDRPIIVMSHIPLHHNSRGNRVKDESGAYVTDENGNYVYDFLQNAYTKCIVDVLNAYGVYMDIIFMFGHNHSNKFDDYLGGSVNYIGKGETMYVSSTGMTDSNGNEITEYGQEFFTEVELNFTYMNYGYAGYSNNTNGEVVDYHTGETVTSTNIETMGVLEICPDRIVVSRYTESGKYPVTKVIDRITPDAVDEPYVNVAGYLTGEIGNQTGAVANANGFGANATYTWTSSDNNVAVPVGDSEVAQVRYVGEGTATITVTVSDGSHTKSASYDVVVGPQQVTGLIAQIRRGTTDISGETLEYYNTTYGNTLSLIGCYMGAEGNITESWSSDNPAVATVNNGLVTFVSGGTTTITYSVTDSGETESASIKLTISDGEKIQMKFVQVDPSTFAAGKNYVIGSTYNHTQIFNENLTTTPADGYMTRYVLSGTPATFEGSDGSYELYIDDPSFVWTTVATDVSNRYNLQNLASGLYLNSSKLLKTDGVTESGSYGTVSFSSDNTSDSSKWRYSTTNARIQSNTGHSFYFRSSTAELQVSTVDSNSVDRYTYFRLFEQAEIDATAIITLGAETVNGTTQTIYNVEAGTEVPLYARLTNFGSGVEEAWSSDDGNIATVDENGVVHFTGEAGEVTITYTVKSSTVETQTLTVKLVAKHSAEPKRVFKYVEEVTAGKKYVMVYKKDVSVGDAKLINANAITATKLLQDPTYVKRNTVSDYYYVEIEEADSDDLVWVTTAGPMAGQEDDANHTGIDTFYFSTEESTGYDATTLFTLNTRFIRAEITGIDNNNNLSGSLKTVLYSDVVNVDENGALAGFKDDLEFYQFSYAAPGLYNNKKVSVASADGSVTYEGFNGIYASSNNNYTRVGKESDANILLFEEVEPEPAVAILSNYRYVGGEIMKNEICPDQTEQFTAEAQNFPEGNTTYKWESSDTSIATVDQTGKVTYTGKSGDVTITVTATTDNDVVEVKSYSNSVTLSVNNADAFVGDIYYPTTAFTPGNKYLIVTNATKDTEPIVGTGYLLTNQKYNDNFLRLYEDTVRTTGSQLYIQNPAAATVWECVESGTSGYCYLKDSEGNYLVMQRTVTTDADGTETETTTATVAAEGEYAEDSYLIRARTSSSLGFGIIQPKSGNYLTFYLSGSGNHRATTDSWASHSYYPYYLAESNEGSTEPEAQIRTTDMNGSVDITSSLFNRYYIKNGDTEQLLRYVVNVEDGYAYEWSSSDTSIANIDKDTGVITYTGKEGYVTVNLKVTGTGTNGEAYSETVSTTLHVRNGGYVLPEGDYPEYPYEGSVRVSKTASNSINGQSFQSTGVTEIELGVTGVPISEPVDVVIVFDHSSSMNDGTMLENAINDTLDFSLQILNDNPNNRVAIVAFDSVSQFYADITATTTKDKFIAGEAGVVTGDGTAQNAFVSTGDEDVLASQIKSLENNSISNTNYDYGLKVAYDVLKAAQDSGSTNDPVVVFMSDGQPNQFNGLQLSTTSAYHNAWIMGDESDASLAPYLADTTTYPAAALFNTDGDNWYSVAIKAPEGSTVAVPDHEFYEGYDKGLGAKVFTIGYGMTDTYGLLGRIASSHQNYYSAATNLQSAYDEILTQILQAANNAVVTDKMGPEFDVQFASSFAMNDGTVTLTPAPKFEVGYWTLDGNGNRVSYNVIETITFTTNDSGILTGASSSIIGSCFDAGASIIKGQYVSYNLNTETFTWNVGEINRTELTLKYYACLEGAAKGEREAGTFDTNEYATLAYTNYRGNPCTKTFPVPTLAWKRAAVSYEFYLVNEAGQPVNLSGVVVPFTDRVIIGREQTKQIALSGDADQTTYNLIAFDELPEGYELYNEEAVFTVVVPNSDTAGSATIHDSTKTTYYRDGSTAVSVDGPVPGVTDCANTAVSFAVKISKGIVPDTVVIDYGLPVRIQVLGNDYYVEGASITGVAGGVTAGTELNGVGYTSSRLDTSAALKYGSAEIKTDGTALGLYYPEYIVYTPTTTNMPAEEVFYYEYKVDNQYYYTTVTVIPAANIYYEESFMTFTDGKDGAYKWTDVGEAITGKFQAEDRPGTFAFDVFDADNAYGEDEAYNDSFTYSLGSAKKTTVDTKAFGKEPTATFTFSGTGFDLFSVTSNDTGAVMVTVTDSNNNAKNYLVNTYYGYTVDENGNAVPSTGTDNSIYQVPVVSKRDLDYGTYTVTIKPLYSSAFDPNYDKATKTGDYSIFVDSVRIFNPAGDVAEDTVIGDAYLKDGEYAPTFMGLRDTVLSAETYYNEVITNLELGYNGSIFIDGNTSNGIDETGIATYKEQGPNNELYLGKNQAVAFLVSAEDKLTLESLQLGMKVVSGGETAEIVVMNSDEKFPNSFTLSGAHETFKKLNSAIIWDQDKIDNGTYTTLYPIVIANVSDTVISLTTFKWAHTFDSATDNSTSALDIIVNGSTAEQATMALRNAMAAQEESTETGTYDQADVSVEWGNDTFTEGKEATLKVTTPPEVVKVTVDGIEITDCAIGDNGEKIWTYSFVVEQAGENAYDVILYDYNNESSDPIKTETIYVEEAEDEPTTDEPSTDDTTDDGSEGVTESKWEKVLRTLLDFFKKVITFIWRIFA